MIKLNHTNLDVWPKRMQLVKMPYKLTSELFKDEEFVLISLLNRASVSVLSKYQKALQDRPALKEKGFSKYQDLLLMKLILKLKYYLS